MFRILKRAACAVCALAVMASVSVSAFADYTYSIDDKKLCDEIQADTRDINGTEGTFTAKFSDSTGQDFLSLRFRLFNDFADLDFWNDDNVSVSVDVRLDTKGKDVIGCLPAFTTNWGWVNPSDYTELKYGEWVTVTETGKHFYDGFAGKMPAYILFQVRTNWGSEAQGDVTISVKNFRITTNGNSAADEPADNAVTTTSAPEETTTSAPEETTTSAPQADPTEEPVTEEHTATAETSNTEESGTTAEPATQEVIATTPDDESSTPPEESAPSDSTSINIPEMEGEQPQDYGDYWNDNYQTESPVMMIMIIIGVAVLIAGGAVVGYLIYRKKKFY